MIAAAYITVLFVEMPVGALLAWHTHTPWLAAAAATFAASYLTLAVLVVLHLIVAHPKDSA